jgi:transposase
MIPIPSGVRVWLASGHTDIRKGFDGLALVVQEKLKRNPHSGHLFVFRGQRGGLIKVPWHDGQGMCLFAKRPERGCEVARAFRNDVARCSDMISPGVGCLAG